MRKLLSGIVFACLGIQAADLTIPANETVEVTDSTALVYNGVTADRYSLVRLGDGVTIYVKAMDATYGLPQHFVANGSVTFDFSQCPSTPWFSGTVVTNGANAVVNVKLPGTELRLGTWRDYSPGTQFGNQQNYALTSGSFGIFWQYSTEGFRFEDGVRPQLTITKAAGFWKNPEDWVNADGTTKTFGAVVYSGKPSVHMLGPEFFGSDKCTIELEDHHLGSMHRRSVGTNVTIRVKAGVSFFFQTCEYQMDADGNPFGVLNSGYDTHYANVDLQGGTIFDRSWNDRLEGTFTGSGVFQNTGWGASNAITSNSVFDVEISYEAQMFGDHLAIATPVLGKPITSVTTAPGGAPTSCSKFARSRFSYSVNANSGDRYMSNGLYYRPPTVELEPSHLPIGTWIGNTCTPTNGPSLKVFAKQLVTIGTLTGKSSSSGVHVHGPTDSSKGLGSVVVGTLTTLGTVYLATNVNFTVTNLNAATTFLVDSYKGENRATFTFLNSDANGQKAIFKAVSPKQLPCVIEGFQGKLEVGPQMVGAEGEHNNDVFEKAETNWVFPIDTTAATPTEAYPFGCGGSGVLDLKYARGTLSVDLIGTKGLKPGRYPLLTCTSGGEALSASNWPLTITRNGVATTPEAQGIIVERGPTGVCLVVPKGTWIFLR